MPTIGLTYDGATAARNGKTRSNAESAVAVPVTGTALLLIDVINDLTFDGSLTIPRRDQQRGDAPHGTT